MEPSIKKNYAYNTLLIGLNFLLPLATFPYLTRVLGPETLGRVNFANSIVKNFILFAMLGLPLYGMREIAKLRDRKQELNKIFSELFSLNLMTMGITYLLYLIMIIFINKFNSYLTLYLIAGSGILLCPFTLDWLCKGLENYRYITLRDMIIKLVPLVFIFSFIKKSEDYLIYVLILSGSSFGGYVFNMIYRRKFTNFTFNDLNLKIHMKFLLITFTMGLTAKLYTEMDKVLIGFLSGDLYVGLYSLAEKVARIEITVVASLTSVLLPRMAYHYSKKELERFNSILLKSIKFVLFVSIPLTILSYTYAPTIVYLLGGRKFNESILTLRILCCIVLFVGLANVFGLQLLYVVGKEKLYLISITIGMVTALLLDLLLIPRYQHNGAAIGTLVAEGVGTLFQIIFSWPYLKPIVKRLEPMKFLLSFVLFVLSIVLINRFLSHHLIYSALWGSAVGSTIFVSTLFIAKESLVRGIMKDIKNKFLRSN